MTPALKDRALQRPISFRTENSFEAVRRREVLALPIRDLGLGAHATLIIRNSGCATVGDLVLCSELEILEIHGVGSATIMAILEKLAPLGLELRDELTEKSTLALRLYGGAEYVPAKDLYFWISGLDFRTYRFLRSVGTLGELASESKDDYQHQGYIVSRSEKAMITVVLRYLGLIE